MWLDEPRKMRRQKMIVCALENGLAERAELLPVGGARGRLHAAVGAEAAGGIAVEEGAALVIRPPRHRPVCRDEERFQTRERQLRLSKESVSQQSNNPRQNNQVQGGLVAASGWVMVVV